MDFADNDDMGLVCGSDECDAVIVDFSVQGLGVRVDSDISEQTVVELLTGEKKVRLNLKLKSSSKCINTFAVLVRYAHDDKFFGLEFFGTPQEFFMEMKKMIDDPKFWAKIKHESDK